MATSACACVPVAGPALSVDLLVQIGVERASCGWGRETKRKSRKRDKQAPPARCGCTWNTDRVTEGMFCNVDVSEIIATGLHDHSIPVLDQLLHRILQWCVCAVHESDAEAAVVLRSMLAGAVVTCTNQDVLRLFALLSRSMIVCVALAINSQA